MTSSGSASPRPALESLTGLRFVAALAVVLYHLPTKPVAWPPAVRLMAFGYLGVSLFFVLSGFILAYTYIDPDTGSLRGSVRGFWGARLARIYPVYLTALLLSLPIFVLFRLVALDPSGRPQALLSATLTPLLLQAWSPTAATQWNSPGWSLSVEVFFYALFPLLAVWLARPGRKAVRIGVGVWLVCLAIPLAYVAVVAADVPHLTVAQRYTWLQAIKFNPAAHLGEFVLGVVAGLAFLRRGPSSWLASSAFAAIAPVGLLLAALVLVKTDWLPYVVCHNGLFAPLWVALVLALASGRGGMSRLLAARPLVRLGEASYALYLLHSPLIGYQELARGFLRIRRPELSAPAWLQAAGFLAVAIAASLVVFRVVEGPARRRIRAWLERGRDASPPARVGDPLGRPARA